MSGAGVLAISESEDAENALGVFLLESDQLVDSANNRVVQSC